MTILVFTVLVLILLAAVALAVLFWALLASLMYLSDRLDRKEEVLDPLAWMDDIKS